MPSFAEGNLTLQFGDVGNPHGANRGVSVGQLLDQINCRLPLGIRHDIAEVPAFLGDQRRQGGKTVLRQNILIYPVMVQR